MCPSFSLCAWRILKMRSCLRRPLAPGRSSERAILVSSVMFFSFSSAMVMVWTLECSGLREVTLAGRLLLGFLLDLRYRRGVLVVKLESGEGVLCNFRCEK